MSETPSSAVLRDLEAATESHPLERKLLVCGSLGEGRELLRELGIRRSWVGWEVTTPRRLAMGLVGPELAAEGLRTGDVFEAEAAVGESLDSALEPVQGPLRELGDAPGFREAVANAVEALRLAGVSPSRVRRAPASNPSVRDLLGEVLERYESALEEAALVDTATVLQRGATLLADGAEGLDGARVFLVPGLGVRGASGRLVRALLDAGAVALQADPVQGLEPPGLLWPTAAEPGPLSGLMTPGASAGGGVQLELFSAAGPEAELREVLRRVMAAGLRWDEVEIVATDPVVYGAALHVLAGRLGIPVSYGVGLPVDRTGTGRAVAAYLQWIEGGFPADVIRRLLESGDLRPVAEHGGQSPAALARRYRRLRIGWGRDRYLPAIDAALTVLEADSDPRRWENREQAGRRRRRERARLLALRSILAPVIEATPPADPDDPGQRVSPGQLAEGLRAFLDRVPAESGPSGTARRRLLDICDRIAATLDRPTSPAAARATLRRHLQIRVPAPEREGSAPWTSSGGHLHLTDIDHGGLTGRAATFVVGLDADRYPGAGLQDPLLLDAQRRALSPDGLPTAADRLEVARFRLAGLAARLRGRVTLSYSAWDPTEARAVAPASVLLQAYRLAEGDGSRTFEDLHRDLGDAACAVPRGAAPVDGADLWLEALSRDGLLLDGEATVRAAFPSVDRGLAAMEALSGDIATPHHGAIRPRKELDPRGHDSIVLSASALEGLGTCPLRYLYRSVLRVRPPDDPELDPDRWLDPPTRGLLLHRVYERLLREARRENIPEGDDRFVDLAAAVLREESDRMAREVPPPGRAVRARELESLRDDVRSFIRMVRERGAPWVALELRFGFDGPPPQPLRLRGGTVQLRGAIDRVDEAPDGLRVIDYKTGSPVRFGRETGVFHEGRRLQNAVYPAVADQLMEATAVRMEYHFPTRRGENQALGFSRDLLRRGLGLIDRLFDAVSEGHFLPTENPDDCRFCDYAPICRVRESDWDRTSPRAEWAGRHLGLPEYRELREVRSWEESFLDALESDETV
jgi:hypothetical protein